MAPDQLGEKLNAQKLVYERIEVSPRMLMKRHALLRLINDHIDKVMETKNVDIAMQNCTDTIQTLEELWQDQGSELERGPNKYPLADKLLMLQKIMQRCN